MYGVTLLVCLTALSPFREVCAACARDREACMRKCPPTPADTQVAEGVRGDANKTPRGYNDNIYIYTGIYLRASDCLLHTISRHHLQNIQRVFVKCIFLHTFRFVLAKGSVVVFTHTRLLARLGMVRAEAPWFRRDASSPTLEAGHDILVHMGCRLSSPSRRRIRRGGVFYFQSVTKPVLYLL